MHSRVLLVDDDVEMCRMVKATLRKNDVETVCTHRVSEALALLETEAFDLLITDVRLPGEDGLALCREVSGRWPEMPIIVITAFGSMETAIAAIRLGAFDFITKPIDIELLRFSVERAVGHGRLRSEVKRLRQGKDSRSSFGELLGDSPAMKTLFDLLGRVADSSASVLISGESGTGKELVARALHQRSARHDQRFLAINCAAMPPDLLESELFGHVKGAFTDAKTDKTGLFVEADGGTLFLDEIGEMPLDMQPKLLRALQERKVRPVGAVEDRAFDVRLIAATNRDLESAVESGEFREDLFYRIHVVGIPVPPLRSRGADILTLAQHFLAELAKRNHRETPSISEHAAQKLLDYDWPGNVRELENCMERALTLTRHESISVEDLPQKIRDHQSASWVISGNNPEDFLTLDELETRYIHRVLEAVDGNRSAAAKILGVHRRTIYRKLEQAGDDKAKTPNHEKEEV